MEQVNKQLNNESTEAGDFSSMDSADITAPEFEELSETLSTGTETASERLSLLEDLQVNIYIELGRTQMLIKDILNLQKGYVIELDKPATEPVDIFVNNKKIAEGEVVVVEKQFGIRITNLLEPSKRIKGL